MRKGIALFIPESPGESAALSTQVPVCAVAKKGKQRLLRAAATEWRLCSALNDMPEEKNGYEKKRKKETARGAEIAPAPTERLAESPTKHLTERPRRKQSSANEKERTQARRTHGGNCVPPARTTEKLCACVPESDVKISQSVTKLLGVNV